MFRTLPSSIVKVWTPSEVHFSAQPSANQIGDTLYETPIQEARLEIVFLSEQTLRDSIYSKDENAFRDEWEFAEDAYEKLVESITQAITDYNRSVVEHAKHLDLKNATVLGKSSTVLDSSSPIIPGSQNVHITGRQSNINFTGRAHTINSSQVSEPAARFRQRRRRTSALMNWIAHT